MIGRIWLNLQILFFVNLFFTIVVFSKSLYVYSWDPVNTTLTLDGGSHKLLPNITSAFGIALDELNGHLYIADNASNNLGNSYPVNNVPIYPYADSPQLAGDEFWIDIYVGDVIDPVSHLYGTSFLLDWDTDWVEHVTQGPDPHVEKGDFLGLPDEVDARGWWHDEPDTIAAAVTRLFTDRTAYGSGIVLRVLFKSRRETPHNTEVCFRISEVTANDSAWNPIYLTPREFCLTIIHPPGIRPNPFTPNDDGYNDYVEFDLPELREDGGVITIFDLWGRKVRELHNEINWYGRDDDGNALQPGSYLYIVKNKGKIIAKGVLGLAR